MSGTLRAGVGQAAAHGMVGHATQAVAAGSRYGVPAARPPSPGTFSSACSGHASTQAPHRVHAARNPISGIAPGGRKYRRVMTRFSVCETRRSSQSPTADRKMSRRDDSEGISMSVKYGDGAG